MMEELEQKKRVGGSWKRWWRNMKEPRGAAGWWVQAWNPDATNTPKIRLDLLLWNPTSLSSGLSDPDPVLSVQDSRISGVCPSPTLHLKRSFMELWFGTRSPVGWNPDCSSDCSAENVRNQSALRCHGAAQWVTAGSTGTSIKIKDLFSLRFNVDVTEITKIRTGKDKLVSGLK